jgi:hypothetical protein
MQIEVKFKAAVRKTEVLEQPQLTSIFLLWSIKRRPRREIYRRKIQSRAGAKKEAISLWQWLNALWNGLIRE